VRIVVGVAMAIVMIVLLVPVSSLLLSKLEGYSEGLAIVAERIGLSEERFYNAPFRDYVIPFIENETLSNIMSGLIGVFVVLAVAYILASMLKSRRRIASESG